MQVNAIVLRAARRALQPFATLSLCLAVLLGGCSSSEPQTFEKAAADATDNLVAQTGKLPTFLARLQAQWMKPDPKLPKRVLMIDPMLDTITGQQTETTALFERRVTQRIGNLYSQFQFLPFQSSNFAKAQYLLTGTMSKVPTAPIDKPAVRLSLALVDLKTGLIVAQSSNFAKAQYLLTGTMSKVPTAPIDKPAVRLSLALVDLKTGLIVAQSSTLAREENLDSTPSRYYRDSPVLIKDKVVEGYAKTALTPVGQRADAYYMERIGAASVISEATSLYNAEKYQDALGTYRAALSTPQGEQLRVQSGIYLSNMKLGNVAEAEQAFGRIVALGIAYNELGVKFLFNPGSVEFWSDPKISGSYGMWLRQIAREAVASKSCVAVVGHTSRSGPAPVNDALSLKRAQYVRQRLAVEAPELAARTRAEGMGFRENIVGSGSDNGFDVLDRRVEFKIVPCA
jgi:outer membrane protein OmpA-like peptidoglycan-associated protein/PBP1b-binding outer membrane lipoprotein LpoB